MGNSLLFIILLFYYYTLFIIFLKKRNFSQPLAKLKKKKFLLVQELSRTFLINTYFPSLFLFLLFSLTANLCDVPLTGLLAASEVGGPPFDTRPGIKGFEVIETFMAFVSKDSLPFPPSAASKRALRAILLIVIIQVATYLLLLYVPNPSKN